MTGSIGRLVAGGTALMLVLASAGPTTAQKSTLPEQSNKISNQPSWIVNQLTLAIAEERRALAGYDAAAPGDDISGPHQAATNAYVLIRAALEGLRRIKDVKKIEDPVVTLAHKKLHAAWNRSRSPVDKLSSGMRRDAYLELSRRQLGETIAMLQEILLIWP
jgi:hypothetical protein